MQVASWLPLKLDWMPPTLQFRETQLATMQEAMKFENYKLNLFIHGKRGVGKTVSTRSFADNWRMEKKLSSDHVAFIPCKRSFPETMQAKFPTIPVRKRIYDWIEHIPNESLIIFDDISVLSQPHSFGNYLCGLFDSLTEKHTDFAIFVTSTIALAVYEYGDWPDSVISRCQFHVVNFEPYTKAQLTEIALGRLRFALTQESFKNDVLSEAIDFIVDKAHRHGSDVRLLLNTLGTSLRTAISEDCKLGLTATESAWEIEKQRYWQGIYQTLGSHRALLLYLYFKLANKEKRISTKMLYREYFAECERLNKRPMKQRMIQNYLRELIEESYLSWHINQTHKGKSTNLKSDLQPEMMVMAANGLNWKEILS